ncbi:hypothetical protein ACFE04_018276 [Oxalis oulophora]
MFGRDHQLLTNLHLPDQFQPCLLGGLFLDDQTLPSSLISSLIPIPSSNNNSIPKRCNLLSLNRRDVKRSHKGVRGFFMSVSFSLNDNNSNCNNNDSEEECVVDTLAVIGTEKLVKEKSSDALNTARHLWAGAVAAMVSRTCVAPLERLKLEYIVRGEQKSIFELIRTIAATQGLLGFWKGNFVNILRTAPFKAINFYAYDTYKNQLQRLTGNEEATNFERLLAGSAAGITATLLCLPMDTIRTVMVAPGGEALGGVIGVFRHMITTEGFFSLYKGLLPSIIAMAPSSAVFYGVYDILKSAYLHSPKGIQRIQNMKQEGQELNALDQLELGPVRTLLYGAIAGVCSEAATYPFEVVRRQLQLQVKATKMSSMATCLKIVQQGGVPALYAGLIPSLLQVLPSAAISYLVYEFMKIVLENCLHLLDELLSLINLHSLKILSFNLEAWLHSHSHSR